jgi:AcrR family transcriptional regulator
MAKARARTKNDEPRRLPRGRHALAPEQVLADQRARLVAAVPGVVAERGYGATSVADIVKRAAVSRNAFYNNFADKRDIFAAAHEAAHERLLGLLESPCETGLTVSERVERSLGVALDALASDPGMARLLFVEAPSSAGEEIALRYHEWLRRYGALLHSLTPPGATPASPVPEMGQVIAGGIASRIAAEVLRGETIYLPNLTPQLVAYLLAFYGPNRADFRTAEVLALELEPEQPPEATAQSPRQANA